MKWFRADQERSGSRNSPGVETRFTPDNGTPWQSRSWTRINLRERSRQGEILDRLDVPAAVRERCYADLARTHKWLGNYNAILRLLRNSESPIKTVLDLGCGYGGLLREIGTKLDVNTIGIDLRPPTRNVGVTIVCGNAVRDPLPAADVALAVTMAHHLSADELGELIRNVGRSCPRLLILDLVRHPLPLALFCCVAAPFVNSINVQDGVRSVQRAFTADEMRRIVQDSLAGSTAKFRHVVAPLYIRQIVDISF